MKIFYDSINNLKLCGILEESSKDKIVVMCHGIRGNKEECGAFTRLSERLLSLGYSTFRFDFNGHGESEGEDKDVTITREIKDLESTINMLEEKGYSEFILLGGSFGAGIISLFPFKKYNNIKGLISWYGGLDYDYVRYGNLFSEENKKIAERDGYYVSKSMHSDRQFRFGLELLNETFTYKPYECLIKCNLTKLFVHGDLDSAVPFKASKEVSDKCTNSTFKLIKNGEHTFMNSEDAIKEAIDVTVDFIEKL